MIISEVIVSNNVKASKRFIKNFSQEAEIKPELFTELLNFVRFRLANQSNVAYNARDYAFHTVAKGFRHCHLIFGKRIIVYKQIGNVLYLLDFCDHSEYEGKKLLRMADTLNNINFNGLDTVDIPEPLTSEQFGEIKDLIEYLVSDPEGVVVLSQALKGNMTGLLDFTRDIAPDESVKLSKKILMNFIDRALKMNR